MAARAEPNLGVLLQLIEELGRQLHAAAETDTIADFRDRHAAAAFEDHLVALQQRAIHRVGEALPALDRTGDLVAQILQLLSIARAARLRHQKPMKMAAMAATKRPA